MSRTLSAVAVTLWCLAVVLPIKTVRAFVRHARKGA